MTGAPPGPGIAAGRPALVDLDAAARMVADLIAAGALRPGRRAGALVARWQGDPGQVPEEYRYARQAGPDPDGPGEQVVLRGAVALVLGRPAPDATGPGGVLRVAGRLTCGR